MEQEITKDVQEKLDKIDWKTLEQKYGLDKIDWKTLEQKYGISRKTVEQSPAIASQLVYGQMTDLVYASTPEMNAMFSLRAYPTQDGDWTVKLYSMEKPKRMHCWKGLHGRTETTTRGTATRMQTAAGRSVLR